MSTNIDLGTFTFDDAAVEKSLKDVRNSIFELTEQQKKYREDKKELEKAIKEEVAAQRTLAKTNGEQSEQYKKTEKNIASLNKRKQELFNKEQDTNEQVKETKREYRDLQKIMRSLTDENGNRISSTEAVTAAVDRENRSIAEARENNKEILALRNQLTLQTKDGTDATQEQIAVMEELNDKLNKNNQFIKESVSGYEQQKINIGDYEGAMDQALGPVGEFIQLQQEAGGVMPLVSTGLKSAGTALASFTKGAIAFIATPLGAVLAVIAGAFLLVRNSINRSEESSNKLQKAIAPLFGLFQKLLSALEPLGEFILDGIVEGLELAEQAFYDLSDVSSAVLATLGFEESAASLIRFKNIIKETSEESKELVQAQSDLEKMERQLKVTISESVSERERLKNIRDDESRSMADRIKANQDLGKLLDKQLQQEKSVAQQSLLIAEMRLKQDEDNTELLNQRADALARIGEVEGEIFSQQNEQITNRNSLQREALDIAKERREDAIKQKEEALVLLEEEMRFNKDRLEVQEKTAEKEIEILKDKLDAKLISQTEYQAEVLAIENNLKEIRLQNEEEEMERIQEFEDRKKELSDEIKLANIEDEREKAELRAQMEYESHVAELENLQLREEEKTELLRLLITQRDMALSEIENSFGQKRLEDFRTMMQQEIAIRRNNANEAASIATELTGILSGLLGDSLGAKLASIAVDAAIQAGLVSITTAAAQAQNLAMAQAAGPVASLALTPIAIGQNAALQASSSAAITKILASAALQGLGTVVKAERGYLSDGRGKLLSGKRHSQGGELIEAEAGEAIINRRSFQMFPKLISDINVAGGGIPLAARGRVAGNSVNNSVVQNRILQSVDMASIADIIGERVELGAERGSGSGTMRGSQQGITQLADRRQIQMDSEL